MSSGKNKRDYYEVLGVNKDATEDDIKMAYRRLAKKYHPDVNKTDPNAKDKFIEMQEAYEVLSDPNKRSNYDRYGFEGVHVDMSDFFRGGRMPGLDELLKSIFGGGGGFGGFGDFFEGFGGGRGRNREARRERGEDIEEYIDISFEEAMFGTKKTFDVERYVPCSDCEGTGAEDKNAVNTCPKCNGTGRMRNVSQTAFGTMIRESECYNCNGTGQVITKKCKTCNGNKVVKETKNIKNIEIPEGVDDSMVLKVQGGGHIPSRNAIPGDLLLQIRVKSLENFIRRGNDLYTKVDLSIVTAILGGKIKIPTLDYKMKTITEKELDIPAGTQYATEFRIRNHGVSYLRGKGKGDQYVIANIVIPKKITDEQKELLLKFQKLSKS